MFPELDSKTKKEAMSRTVAYFMMFVFSFPATAWSSFVGITIWEWFAVPIGAPHISLVQGMGLSVLLFLFRNISGDVPDKKFTVLAQQNMNGIEIIQQFFVDAAAAPTIALVVAWVISLFL